MYTNEQEVEDFLAEYSRSKVIIATTARAVLNRAIGFEQKFDKPFYQFTADEILEVHKSAHAISVVSLQNTNLLLKNAARWMKYKRGDATDSAYESITKDMLDAVVDKEKQKSLMLSREDVEEIMDQLLNWTDRCIVFLLFQGVDGYLLDQLTFLSWEQVSRNDLKIYFHDGKMIDITEDDYEMLKNGFEEDELVSFGSTARTAKVRGHGVYKVRSNALSDNSNPNNPDDVGRRYRFITRRLTLISQDLGVKINPTSLQTSGLLWHLQQGMKGTGMNFREFVRTSEAKEIAKRYGIASEFYGQILLEKFTQYFKED